MEHLCADVYHEDQPLDNYEQRFVCFLNVSFLLLTCCCYGKLFANELAAGVIVRLIYNGQVLLDHQTFNGLGILNDSFILCAINIAEENANAQQGRREDEQLDRFGGWLAVWIICGFLLVALWVLCFTAPAAFTNTTVVLMDVLTLGLTAWIVLTMRANQPRLHQE